jgi:CBS domain-containing membrane protein
LSRSQVLRWLSRFAPAPINVRWPERLRSSIGALIGIVFTGALMHATLGSAAAIPLLVAPMGASAVLLFAVPSSPLAQPWSLIGGNLVSATVGVACAHWIADPVAAAAVAISVAICAMFALRCVHPPSGAVALTAVLGGPAIHALGFRFVLAPIAVQSTALLCAALAYHALTGHRYPHAARDNAGKPAAGRAPHAPAGFTRADLMAVLKRRGELLDIDPDDLEALLRETQLQAYARSFSELSAADVMSPDVISVAPATTAPAAADLLRRHGVKSLPVIDASRHVKGIVTRADLADHAHANGLSLFDTLSARWFRSSSANRHDSVGALMSTHVQTVFDTTPLVDLVPMFAHEGHHHIPVVDRSRRLVGIITQVDLIAGLYRQTQAEAGQPRAA